MELFRYYTTLLILLIGISVSVFFERKKNGGFIEFKDALKCGVLYSVLLSLILAVFNYFYYTFLVPDAVDFFVSEAKKSMVEGKLKEESIAKSLEVVKSYFGSFRMLMSTLIMGIILSLIAGGIFRKKNPFTPFSAN